jgi:hypothetical protein
LRRDVVFPAVQLRRRNPSALVPASRVPNTGRASRTLNDTELRKYFRRKNTRRKSFLEHAQTLNDLPIEAAKSAAHTAIDCPRRDFVCPLPLRADLRRHNVAVATWPDIKADLDIVIEFDQHGDQAFDGEALQLCLPYARKIGRCKSGQLVRAANADAEIIQHSDDLRRENCFRVQDIRIGMAKIAEHISTSTHQFQIAFGHRNISFSRLSRSLIRSTSICGVLIPLFDFF